MLCLGTPVLFIKNTPCYNFKSVLLISKKEMVAKGEEVVERGWSQKCHAGRKSLLSAFWLSARENDGKGDEAEVRFEADRKRKRERETKAGLQ